MKYLIFILASLFTISSCDGNQEGFASISAPVDLASQVSDYTQDLKSIVKEESESIEVKISGKKRTAINITDTVGNKNLNKDTAEVQNRSRDVAEVQNIGGDEGNNSIARLDTLNIKATDVTQGQSLHKISSNKVDILFYMKSKGECTEQFRVHSSTKGFIARIGELDWQVVFSYYAEDLKEYLIPLKYFISSNRRYGYVLSKGLYYIQDIYQIFQTTLYKDEQQSRTGNKNVLSSVSGTVSNPLGSLDHILSTNPKGTLRDDAPNVVLLFGDDFPHYSSQEWDQFFTKHKNTSVVVAGGFNASNAGHSLERQDKKVIFLPCDSDNFVDFIHSKVQ